MPKKEDNLAAEASANAELENLEAEIAESTEVVIENDDNVVVTEENPPEVKKERASRRKTQMETPEETETKIEIVGGRSTGAEAEKTRAELLRESREKSAERDARKAEKDAFLSGWSALDTSKKRKQILYGTIAGVEEVSIEGTERGEREPVAILLAVILDGRFKVLIPFDEFYKKNIMDMSTVDLTTKEGKRSYLRRQRQMAGKLLGCEIPFTITEMFRGSTDSYDDYSIGGSRKEAITILEKSNFTADPKTGRTRLSVGNVVDGHVTSVAQYGLSMNVGGVDVNVYIPLLTYKYVKDLRDFYYVGQRVPVEIKKIDTTRNGDIKLEVSGKPIELASAKARQHMLSEGTNVVGTITSINESKRNKGEIIITAYLPTYDMPAIVSAMPPSRFGSTPETGDSIGLVITGFSETGMVFAYGHRLIKNPTGFVNR